MKLCVSALCLPENVLLTNIKQHLTGVAAHAVGALTSPDRRRVFSEFVVQVGFNFPCPIHNEHAAASMAGIAEM